MKREGNYRRDYLSHADIRAIKADLAEAEATRPPGAGLKIAAKYGITPAMVSMIKSGKRHKEII